MKNRISSPLVFLILVGLSILPLLGFLVPGLPITHDGQDHVVRIANFFHSLTEGILIPRWAGNLNWGYGHPILMFLYPLPSYVASSIHILGLSFVDSTKAVFFLTYIASIISMYLWMSTVWGKRVGFVGALLYGFAPYRFVDMWVRGAIGEHVAFIFPPLICFFLYKLAHPEKNQQYIQTSCYFSGLSFSIAGFILSHNAVSLMFAPVLGFYIFYAFLFESRRSLKFLICTTAALLIGFGLSSFFWIPAFYEGKYTLRYIVTAGEAMTRFVRWSDFFSLSWSYGGTMTLSKSIGIAQWMGIIAALLLLLQTKQRHMRVFLIAALSGFIGSLFIQTQSSAFIWSKYPILQNFQFPWRFLAVSVFLAAVLGGLSITVLIRKKTILYGIVCIGVVAVTWYMWYPKGNQRNDESFYTGIYAGTTDTGESSPIWSVRFMEHTAANPMEVIDGEAKIEPGRRLSTIHEYKVQATKQTRLVENTLYFPGWKIYVDGISAGIQFQDPRYRGLMTFWIDEGDHNVQVLFTDTKLRYGANMITLISIGLLVLSGLLPLLCRRKK